MRDTELYRHLLGLEDPWTVSRVELKVKEQRVDVWAGHPEGISGPVRSAERHCPCTTIRRSAAGGIWTAASS